MSRRRAKSERVRRGIRRAIRPRHATTGGADGQDGEALPQPDPGHDRLAFLFDDRGAVPARAVVDQEAADTATAPATAPATASRPPVPRTPQLWDTPPSPRFRGDSEEPHLPPPSFMAFPLREAVTLVIGLVASGLRRRAAGWLHGALARLPLR